MTEFLAGLVAILVLVAGMVQLASITRKHTNTMIDARAMAGQRAVDPVGWLQTSTYIKDWREGGDGKRYTADDEPLPDTLYGFNNEIVDRSADSASGWDLMNNARYDHIADLRDVSEPPIQFGMVNGSSEADIQLLPVFQRLIYAAQEINLETEVWMTWTKGIY